MMEPSKQGSTYYWTFYCLVLPIKNVFNYLRMGQHGLFLFNFIRFKQNLTLA